MQTKVIALTRSQQRVALARATHGPARGITINAVFPDPILTGLRQHSHRILGPGRLDTSGPGVASQESQTGRAGGP